jgi:general secretion pathway protein B
MSSILKALRKLEEEKAARREGGFDIARDILRTSSRRRPAISWRLPAAILGAVLLFGWGGYRLAIPSAPVPASVPVIGQPLPASTVAPPKNPALSAAIPPAAMLHPRTVVAEPPIVEEVIEHDIPASFPVQTRARPIPAAKAGPAPVASSPVPAVPPSPKTQAAVQDILPALVLSDIVYHDDPDARLAIINDLPVMLGTAIDETVVEEILRDRVRLSRNGKIFEIRIAN